MTDDTFRQLVENAIDTLPLWVKKELTNVAFIVEDEPNDELRETHGLGEEDTLFGHYEGVPLSERGNESPPLPDIITIFKKPILETYEKESDIRACVENTVWHEVAHYFGHDEEWVEKEERRRGRVL